MENKCLFARKQIYSTVIEVRLIFKRKNKNVNYIPNYYPTSMHLNLVALFAEKKLML
jgi:hypothetical protein